MPTPITHENTVYRVTVIRDDEEYTPKYFELIAAVNLYVDYNTLEEAEKEISNPDAKEFRAQHPNLIPTIIKVTTSYEVIK